MDIEFESCPQWEKRGPEILKLTEKYSAHIDQLEAV